MTKPKAPTRLPQPDQPLVDDGRGVVRFQENTVVRALLGRGRLGVVTDLNLLAQMEFPEEDWRQFNQLIGYSVCGACDLSCFEGKPGDRVWRKMEAFGKKFKMSPRPEADR